MNSKQHYQQLQNELKSNPPAARLLDIGKGWTSRFINSVIGEDEYLLGVQLLEDTQLSGVAS